MLPREARVPCSYAHRAQGAELEPLIHGIPVIRARLIAERERETVERL